MGKKKKKSVGERTSRKTSACCAAGGSKIGFRIWVRRFGGFGLEDLEVRVSDKDLGIRRKIWRFEGRFGVLEIKTW